MSKKRTKHIEAYSTRNGNSVLVINHDLELWLWLGRKEYGNAMTIADMMESGGHGVPFSRKYLIPQDAIKICL